MRKIMFSDRFGLTDAVLTERKTMTRRIIAEMVDRVYEERPHIIWCEEYESFLVFKGWDDIDPFFIRPRYKPGDVVAVAQRYKDLSNPFCGRGTDYTDAAGWENKMFVRADLMPHQLRITNVRVERLQDISYEDCLREGVLGPWSPRNFSLRGFSGWFETPDKAFAALIDKISGKGTWASNPWVLVYEFELVK